ncbi:argininosuccinate lyase [Candidatus Microgenomates bacterium]|nr:argininosuccinate lyase [Candidatus Microgenomates bacterium]
MKNSKIYSGIYKKEPSKKVDAFLLDEKQQKVDSLLVPYYLWETIAHNLMLVNQKIINKKIGKKILKALVKLYEKADKEGFFLDPEKGDIHENFEKILTGMIGKDGGWFHLARSRNDQIFCDQKLLTKKLFFDFGQSLVKFCQVLGEKSQQYPKVIMPGFTHLRTAMPSSFGFWWQSYLEQIIELEKILQKIFEVTDKNPLGAGASYGVNWPINPEETAKNLGFAACFKNSLAALDSRGFHEFYLVSCLSALVIILSRMMEDLIIWSLPQLDFIKIDEKLTSGSSIMPQKMNPDIAEKIRSKTGLIVANLNSLLIALKGTPSGYNRDSAETKIVIVQSLSEVKSVLDTASFLIKEVVPNKEKMLAAAADSLAVKLADVLVQKCKIDFRSAHKIVGKSISLAGSLENINSEILAKSGWEIAGKKIEAEDELIKKAINPQKALSLYGYQGSPNPSKVLKVSKVLVKENKDFEIWLENKKENFQKAEKNLIKKVKKFLKEG